MRKLIMFLCAVTLVFGMMGTARAMVYTDTHIPPIGSPSDPTGVWMDSGGAYPTYSWTFDITTDGFDPVTQDVTSADLSLNLWDDGYDYMLSLEFAYLVVGGGFMSVWEVNTGPTDFTLTSLASLSDNGTVDVILGAAWGDFWLDSATLTAQATEPVGAPIPNPEPATVMLMGIGIAGILGAGARKRFKKKAVDNS